MLYHNVHVFAHYLRVIDAATVGVTTAVVWRLGVRMGTWGQETTAALLVFAGSLLVWFVVVGGRMQIYHARRAEHILREMMALLEVGILATGISCVVTEVATGGLPGSVYGVSFLAAMATLLGVRAIVRVALRRLRRGGRDYRTWLIVGRNSKSAQIAREVLSHPHYGIRIEQVVDIPDKQAGGCDGRLDPFRHPPLDALPQCELTGAAELCRMLADQAVDEVVMTLPLRSCYDEVQEIHHRCSEAGVSIKFLPQAFDRWGDRTNVAYVGEIPLVTHFSGPSNHSLLLVKRLLDILGAAAGLVGVMILTFLHPRMRNRYVLARMALIGAVLATAAVFSGEIRRWRWRDRRQIALQGLLFALRASSKPCRNDQLKGYSQKEVRKSLDTTVHRFCARAHRPTGWLAGRSHGATRSVSRPRAIRLRWGKE